MFKMLLKAPTVLRGFFDALADTPVSGIVKRLVAGFFSEYQRLSPQEALLDFTSRADLARWLRENSK